MWQEINEGTPKDCEILLYYPDWLGEELIVSGHWDEQPGRESEATWMHSYGCGGSATHWMDLPAPPPKNDPGHTYPATQSGE